MKQKVNITQYTIEEDSNITPFAAESNERIHGSLHPACYENIYLSYA